MDDPTSRHHDGVLGHLESEVSELLDHNDGHPLTRQLLHHAVERLDDDRSQAHGELVEEQEPWPRRHGPGHGKHLLLPSGHGPRLLMPSRRELRKMLEGSMFDLFAGGPTMGHHPEVLLHRQVGEDALSLGNQTEPLADQPICLGHSDPLAVEDNLACRNLMEARQDGKQRGFSCPVRPEYGRHAPRGDAQIHAVDHLDALVAGAHPADFEE